MRKNQLTRLRINYDAQSGLVAGHGARHPWHPHIHFVVQRQGSANRSLESEPMSTAIPEQTEDEKHAKRKTFVGGSDIAGICGISPWDTPADIFRKKTQPRENPTAAKKKLFRRGHAWESVVAEMLQTELELRGHTVEVVSSRKQYVDKEHDFFASEIDFEIRLDGEEEITNCELKTVSPFAAASWGATEAETPDHYTAQVHWGLGVTGRKRGILAALFGADELRVYPVPRDEDIIKWMRQEALAFWQDHVTTGVEPEPKTLGDLAKRFANDNGETVVADEKTTEAWLKLRAVQKQIKACEAEAEALEFVVKRSMGSAQILESPSFQQPIVTWKDRKSTRLDQTALKAAHPKIHREFSKTSTSRFFTVKEPKK